MIREEAREVLGDVRAYLASRASLEKEMFAGHTFIDICNAIKALEHESDWIPVSERLPKWGEEVLTINNDGDYEINHIMDDERNEWFYDNDIVAWMPLPEHYKETEDV
jgi:arginine/ornithine N-succinyltransferase beta subunit